MSGQPRSPSIPPPQPQPFRFWLPYRSNAASLSRPPLPASPRPQPPPAPAEPAPRAPPSRAVVEDIPIQADSSDESDTIAVEALDALRLRGGARQAVADLELTLSRSRPAPNGQEQGTTRDDGAKVSISGFPRAHLFDSARAPHRREIEDGLKSLAAAARETPPPPDNNQGYRVITLAGHNVGASMVLGSGSGGAPLPEGSAAVATSVNSNVQGVNNSTMEGSSCSSGDPGVRVDVVKKEAREEPGATAPSTVEEEEGTERKEKPDQEPARTMPPQEKGTAGSGGGGGEAARPPTRTRRCLRALMMETRKPRPTACRFQCVAEHASPGTAGGGGGKSAEEGAEERTR